MQYCILSRYPQFFLMRQLSHNLFKFGWMLGLFPLMYLSILFSSPNLPEASAGYVGYYGLCFNNNACPSSDPGMTATFNYNAAKNATEVTIHNQQSFYSTTFDFDKCEASVNTGQYVATTIPSGSSNKQTCTFDIPTSWKATKTTVKITWADAWGSASWSSYGKCFKQSHCDNRTATFDIPNPDTTPPTLSSNSSFRINNDSVTTNALTVNVSGIYATDDTGVSYCQAKNESGSWTNVSCNSPFNWTLSSGISGSRTVYGQACDMANQCSQTSDTITYQGNYISYPDTVQGSLQLSSRPNETYPTWPSNFTFDVNNGAYTAPTNNQVTVSAIRADSVAGISYCSLSNDAISWTNVACDTNNLPWTLSEGTNDLKTVYARACNAENRCAYVGDNIGGANYTGNRPPVITHLSIIPTNPLPGTKAGYTSSPSVSLRAYINDQDSTYCDIDQGSGFGSDFSTCNTKGYKTFPLNTLSGVSTLESPQKTVTLRAWDATNTESRVTASIIYENTPPTATLEGYVGGVLNTPFIGNVTMHCEDDFGCQNISYYVGTYGLSTSCQDVDNNPELWTTCDPAETDSCTRNLTVDHYESLCTKVTDNIGRVAFSERSRVEVDDEAPQFSQVNLYATDAQGTETAVMPKDGVYYMNATSVRAFFEVTDRSPTWQYNGFGDASECNVTLDGNPINASCSYRNGDYLSSFTLNQPLPEGSHTLMFSLADQFVQTGTLTFPVFVDTERPSYNLGSNISEIQVTTDEPASLIRMTLPATFEDNGGSGIGEIHISLTQDGALYPLDLMNIVDSTTYMRVEDSTLILTPNTTSGGATFPESIAVWGLERENTEGIQHQYGISLTAFDRAGNELEERPDALLSRNGLTFDTLSPVVGVLSRPGMSPTRFGNGTSMEDPYRVGADRYVSLRIPLTEQTNNYKMLATPPVHIRNVVAQINGTTPLPAGDVYAYNTTPNLMDGLIDSIVGGADPSAAMSTGCDTLDASRSCNALVTFSIPENFVGSVTFETQDGAGNASVPTTFWVKQDSRPPLLLSDFNLTANIAPGEHYKGTLYRFTASGIDPNGDDKALTAYIRYLQEGATEPTLRQATVTATGGNTFTFDAPLENIAYGAQNIEIYFEDNYGNRHDGSAAGLGETVPYAVFHDNVAPDVLGFAYAWSDNDVTVSFDSVTEDSFPLLITPQTSSDGITWTARGETLTRADAANAANTSFVLSDVSEEEQIRVVFGDTVRDYQNGAVVTGTNPRTDYIVRDMLLTVTEQGESLRVSYTPESGVDLSSFGSYTVSYTGPHGRTGSFPLVETFDENGALIGNIERPLIGTYTFTVSLSYTDGRPNLNGTKTYEQTTDIITPLASMTLPLVPNVITYNEAVNRYYVRTSSPALTLGYTISPEFTGATTIFDDSLPLTITVEGAEDSVTESITPTGTGAFTGTISVDLLQEREYTLLATIADGAGRSLSFPFTVVKDASIPQFSATFVDPTSSTPLTVMSNKTDDVFMTAEPSSYLDVVVTNENEAVTYSFTVDGATLTEVGTVPDQAPETQSRRLLLENLENELPAEVTITIRDQAGSSFAQTVTLQRDTSAPELVAGSVAFSQESYAENPVGIDAQFDDYSQVDYIVTVDDQVQARRAYNGMIRLPEGENQNISIVFLDALDNATEPYIIENSVYVDSVNPSATFRIAPDTERTNEPTATLSIDNLVESGPQVSWSIHNNGMEVGSGEIMRGSYSEASDLAQILLTENSTNILTVTLRDSLQNALTSQEFTLIHDNEAPEVTFEPVTATPTQLSWNFTVEDAAGSGVSEVTARVRNTSNGMSVSSASLQPVNGVYSFASAALPLTSGQRYILEVGSTDGLGNSGTARSTSVLIEGSTDQDPLLTPIDLPDTLTGDRITVTVTNGSTINYVAEDMPRGTSIYLQDVLALGTNTLTGTQLEKFPVGYYTITIEDNEGHTHIIEDYLVSPYYLDADADINGDGYNGGLTDHKLQMLAELIGTIYENTPEMQSLVETQKQIIQNNISSEVREFLIH